MAGYPASILQLGYGRNAQLLRLTTFDAATKDSFEVADVFGQASAALKVDWCASRAGWRRSDRPAR